MMNHNDEIMDEEKTFEVVADMPPTKVVASRRLTEVSQMFDRTGKGYLDPTERALRQMDSQNQGFLGVDKVCVIFESLQQEQERSSQLLEALRLENKKSLSLKRGVIALTAFTVLLALANVGTSFAVTKLVKDMKADNGDLVDKNTGLRLGTSSKLISFEIDSLEGAGERRRLQLNSQAGLACEVMTSMSRNAGVTKECSLQGVMKLPQANALHSQLENVEKVQLTCLGKRSLIYGSTMLQGEPGIISMGSDMMAFPNGADTDDKYQASQSVSKPGGRCNAQFELAMYCPTQAINGQLPECLVMSAYLPTEGCPTSPVVCGPKPQTASGIDY